jgi:hypothetical protein
VDVRALPLSPLEGFVLSRIDGAASVGDIADLTNQSLEECSVVIERLLELAAIEWADGSVSLPRASMRPSHPYSGGLGSLGRDTGGYSSGRASSTPPVDPSTPSTRPSVLPRGVAVEEQNAARGSQEDRRGEPLSAARQENLDRQKLPYRPTEYPKTPATGIEPSAAIRPPAAPLASFTSSGPAPGPGASRPSAASAGPQPPLEPTSAPPADTAVDEIDLSPERRKRIDDLWVALDLLNHYDLLELSQKASRQEVKAAYYERSKIFHPDTAFRKKIGNYRTKMEAIFKRLTEAYDVLGKPKARAAYDAYLTSIGEARDAEEALSGEKDLAAIEATTPGTTTAVGTPAPRSPATGSPATGSPATGSPATGSPATGSTATGSTAAGSTAAGSTAAGSTAAGSTAAGNTAAPRSSAPPPSSVPPHGHPVASSSRSGTMPAVGSRAPSGPPPEPPPEPMVSTRPVSDESRRRAAELFQRRLDGARGRSTPGAVTPPEPSFPRSRDEMARELRTAISTSTAVSGGIVAGGDLVAKHVAEARRAEAQGDLAMAVRALRIAVATAPSRLDLAAEHERVGKLLAVSLADRYTDQAVYEERVKKWAAAALSWAKVLEGRPDDLTALMGAAVCLLEAQGDLHKAQRFAQRAVEQHPQNGAALRVLARVCLAAGLPLNARRALQQALSIDATDTQAKALLDLMTQS